MTFVIGCGKKGTQINEHSFRAFLQRENAEITLRKLWQECNLAKEGSHQHLLSEI